MESTDLLLKLQELEDSLQAIDSAKNEVNKTVNAYSVLGFKISSYAENLNDVSQQLKNLQDTIKDAYTSLQNRIEKQQGEFATGFIQSVNQADTTLQTTSAEFKSTTDAAKETIAESIKQTENDFKEQVNSASETFSEHCNNAAASFKETLTEITISLQNEIERKHNEIADRLSQSVNQADTTLQTTSAEFKNTTDATKESIIETVNKTKNDFKEQVNNLSEIFSGHCDNAAASFKNAAATAHNDMDRFMSETDKAIKDYQQQISEIRIELLNEEKKLRKWIYIILILVVGLIIINFIRL